MLQDNLTVEDIKVKTPGTLQMPSVTRNNFPDFDNQKPFLKWAGTHF